MIGTKRDSTFDVGAIHGRLVAERDRLKQLVGAVTGNLSLADDGQDASSAKLRTRLNEVVQAIGRIERGTFGTCAGCSKTISPTRLESSPTVSHCLGCEMLGLAAN